MNKIRYSLCLLTLTAFALLLLARGSQSLHAKLNSFSRGTARRALSIGDADPPTKQAPTPPIHESAQIPQPLSLPLPFEPNIGQAIPQVAFLARGQRLSTFLTRSGIDLEPATRTLPG